MRVPHRISQFRSWINDNFVASCEIALNDETIHFIAFRKQLECSCPLVCSFVCSFAQAPYDTAIHWNLHVIISHSLRLLAMWHNFVDYCRRCRCSSTCIVYTRMGLCVGGCADIGMSMLLSFQTHADIQQCVSKVLQLWVLMLLNSKMWPGWIHE